MLKSILNLIKAKRGLLASFFVFALILGLAFSYLKPLSVVKKVKVKAYQLNYQEIIKQTGLKKGVNRLFVLGQSSAINNKIEKSPYLKSVSYTIDKNDVLTITAQEILVGGYYQKGNQYFRMNSVGVYTTQAVSPTSMAPIYSNFSKKNVLQATVKGYFKSPAEIRNSISQVIFAPDTVNPDRVALIMSDNNVVFVDPST
ncbi:MAG: hypothetical protein LBM27_03280, partial [Lactobacillaceae bacterium]|nr:hypothetical protein [Lactobacillaceae bacterium]